MKSALSVVQNAGLSENTAKIYTALLRKGRGNYSSLAAATGLHPQSVKNALRELMNQGFVIRLDHKLDQTLWRPSPPFEIAKRLRQKYETFARALPGLQAAFRQHPTTVVHISSGLSEAMTHLRQLIDHAPKNTTITLRGSVWPRLRQESEEAWNELQALAKKRGLRIANEALKKDGPLSFAMSDRACVMFIFDPTESTIVTVNQPRVARQLRGLLS